MQLQFYRIKLDLTHNIPNFQYFNRSKYGKPDFSFLPSGIDRLEDFQASRVFNVLKAKSVDMTKLVPHVSEAFYYVGSSRNPRETEKPNNNMICTKQTWG